MHHITTNSSSLLSPCNGPEVPRMEFMHNHRMTEDREASRGPRPQPSRNRLYTPHGRGAAGARRRHGGPRSPLDSANLTAFVVYAALRALPAALTWQRMRASMALSRTRQRRCDNNKVVLLTLRTPCY